MKNYQIEIKETLAKTINICANTKEEAIAEALDMYLREEIVLDYTNLKGMSIDTEKEEE